MRRGIADCSTRLAHGSRADLTVLATRAPLSSWLVAACGVWLVALGFYFMLLRPPLLAEDARYIGTSVARIGAELPGLGPWLQKVFAVLGGFMAATGALAIFIARVAMRGRLSGTSWAIALSGAFSVGLMSATNFALDSDFKVLLLVPALTWLAGLLLYIARR